MLKYAKVCSEESKAVFVGMGSDNEFYEKNGFRLMEVEQGFDGQWYVAGNTPKITEAKCLAAFKAEYERTVEGWLAEFAATRGYKVSNMGAYAASGHPIYGEEAKFFIQLQCDTWDACYAILNAVFSGERAVPTREELYAELPVSAAQWPSDNSLAEKAVEM